MLPINISDDDLTPVSRESDLHDDVPSIRIDAFDFDRLLQASKEYDALKNALLAAGVAQDHLETLVNSQLPHQDYVKANYTKSTKAVDESEGASPKSSQLRWSAEAAVFVPMQSSSSLAFDQVKPICSIPPTPPSLGSEEDESKYYCDDHQNRSVALRGLSPFTTLADIANIVRGGMVLNMFMRAKVRMAHVAFVDPIAAEKFVMHSKRNDLYLKGKRIEVLWDERQFSTPGYIQRQVLQNGATRNIVIRSASQDMTAESVREDLEHIHRLEVVNIFTTENHIFISTNAIQHAITARHCMQSRLKYKGSRIDFFNDECDQVLPGVVKKTYKSGFEPQKRPATVAMANRYALLFDGDDALEDKDKPMKRVASAGEVQTPA